MNGQNYGERLVKEAFWLSVTRDLKKDTGRSIMPAVWGSLCPCTLGAASVPASQAAVPPSCSTLTGAELTQAKKKKKKKVLQLCVQGRFGLVQLFATLWPARLLYQGGVFSKQEYRSALANTGCHTLLEHYISCSPSCQLPWVPCADRTPVI